MNRLSVGAGLALSFACLSSAGISCSPPLPLDVLPGETADAYSKRVALDQARQAEV